MSAIPAPFPTREDSRASSIGSTISPAAWIVVAQVASGPPLRRCVNFYVRAATIATNIDFGRWTRKRLMPA